MPDEPVATTEAPAAPADATITPAVTTPQTDTPVTLTPADMVGLDPKMRDKLLFDPPKAVVEPEVPAEVTEATGDDVRTETPAEEVKTEATPVVPASEATTEEEEGDEITKNFRLHTEDPKLSAFLKTLKSAQRTNPNVNPADVAKLVGYSSQEAEQQIPGMPVAAPQPPAEIVNARAELAALETKLDDAAADGVLFTPELAKLNREYATKRAELSTLELRYVIAAEQDQQARSTQAVSERQAQIKEVEKDYASLADSESDLNLEVDRLYYAMEANPQHPDRARLAQKDGPAWLIQTAAKNVVARLMKRNSGMTEAQALNAVKGKPMTEAKGPVAATPKPATAQPTPVPRTALVTSPGGRQAPEAVKLSAQQIMERAAKDPKYRDAALGFNTKRVIA